MTAGFYENDGEHIISIDKRLARRVAINIFKQGFVIWS
jgi:hypothetical protein